MTILERVLAAGRPLQVKGKGALLDPLIPRTGSGKRSLPASTR